MRVVHHPVESTTEGIFTDCQDPAITQLLHCLTHRCDIPHLVWSYQSRCEFVGIACSMVCQQGAFMLESENHPLTIEFPVRVDAPFAVGEGYRALPFCSDTFEHGLGLRLCLTYDNRNARFDYTSLLVGYLLKGVAKELGVIQSYIGDYAE